MLDTQTKVSTLSNKISSIFALAIPLLLIITPLYVWRFSVPIAGFEFPTNFLMVFLFAVIGIGVIKVLVDRKWAMLTQSVIELGKPMLVGIVLFSLASLVSLLAFGLDVGKLSQWVVLYLQPLLIFILVRYYFVESGLSAESEGREKFLNYFRIACYVFVGVAGALAIVQYFTLLTLPDAWLGNTNEPKRAIAFFAHPNAFGLFVTPLLAWLIPDMVNKLRAKNILLVFFWALGGVGILLSLSRGAWLGLLAAFGVYVVVKANKKLLLGFAGVLIVIAGIVAVVPNLRYRVLLPFHGEKSSVARFSLWNTGTEMIKDSPILGKGVNGFKNNWDAYNKDAGLEHYNFPHNIFLNFWVDVGLVGLVSMMWIMLLGMMRGIVKRNNAAALGLLLFIVALGTHGLIDIPYFKNDLALLFWLILALSL